MKANLGQRPESGQPAQFASAIWKFLAIAVVVLAIAYAVAAEDGFTEAASFVLLVCISVLVRDLFDLRNRAEGGWRHGTHVIWFLISLGFLFLALDEAFSIHERLDQAIHKWVIGKETGLSDRLDDLIVLGYGLIGIGLIYYYREEFVRFPGRRIFLALGFLFMVLMVGFDMMVNRDDLLLYLGYTNDRLLQYRHMSGMMEEYSKLLSEVSLLLYFHTVRRQIGGAAGAERQGSHAG